MRLTWFVQRPRKDAGLAAIGVRKGDLAKSFEGSKGGGGNKRGGPLLWGGEARQ